MSLIEIRHLRKEYPGGAVPIRDLSATVEEGEVVSIIGPSGTGKSTLIRCMNRLEDPTSGEIVVGGRDVCAPGTDLAALRREMGMVFQGYALFGHRRVVENLMMAPMDLLGLTRGEAYERAMSLLELVGLRERALSWPSELSGGQRQRVAIARALAMRPRILLFDEPTSALDPQMVSEVLSVITDLASRGLTMLVVTHEMRFARDASTRVFYMDRGEVWEQGPPEQIFGSPRRAETHDFVFRVRSWEWRVSSVDYDFRAQEASLLAYCARQFMGERESNACALIAEEVLASTLVPAARARGVADPDVLCRLSAGEGGVDTVLEVSYGPALLEGGDPLAPGAAGLSAKIAEGLCSSVERPEPGLVRYHVGK